MKNICLYGATVIVAALVVVANYLVFFVVENERTMGAVQRIFYFHVGSAFACYAAVVVMLAGGLWYLATRDRRGDFLQQAGGEVGLVFCSMTLFSGMIWGASAWNTAFRWSEPRLVSFLCLWLLFIGFAMLRRFGDRSMLAAHSAVLSIIGAITVPIVVYSVKFLSHVGQLHPVVIENQGLRDPSFKLGFWFVSLTLIALQALLVWVSYRIAAQELQIEMLEANS